MSEIGLYSGLYHQIRTFAELLDSVLVKAASEHDLSADDEARKLADLLVAAGKARPAQHRARVLAMVMRHQKSLAPAELADVGAALLTKVMSQTMFERLERVALAVDRERATTFHKMRGR